MNENIMIMKTRVKTEHYR